MPEYIRPINPQTDVQGYAELRRARAQEGYGSKEELTLPDAAFESQLQRKALHVVAENSSGKMIGINGAALLKDGVSANLRGLYIVPEERGKGTGKRLVETMMTLLREKGIKTIYTEIENDNARSILLHLSLGFVQYETVTDKQGKKYERFVYRVDVSK
jgi:L-amino acid N-acyltransferase YncA